MSAPAIIAVTLFPDIGYQEIAPPVKYKGRSDSMLVIAENAGLGSATIRVHQSYFGGYYDDDSADVTTMHIPPGQERCALIDVSFRGWYKVTGNSVNGNSTVRVALICAARRPAFW